MPLATALMLIAQYGPQVMPLISKLVADFEAGKSESMVSTADLDILSKLASQTGEDIYKRLGITPPPAAP